MQNLRPEEILEAARQLVARANDDIVFGAAITFAASNMIAAAAVSAPDGQLRCLKSMLASFEAHTRECFKHFQKNDGSRDVHLPSKFH